MTGLDRENVASTPMQARWWHLCHQRQQPYLHTIACPFDLSSSVARECPKTCFAVQIVNRTSKAIAIEKLILNAMFNLEITPVPSFSEGKVEG